MKLTSVIRRPLITEKTTVIREDGRTLVNGTREGDDAMLARMDDALRRLTLGNAKVLLVTVPEETPVNETVETAFALEDELGLHLGPLLVNGVLPGRDLPADTAVAAGATSPSMAVALDRAAAFSRNRQQAQRRQLDRLAEQLPLPQLVVHRRAGAGLTPAPS